MKALSKVFLVGLSVFALLPLLTASVASAALIGEIFLAQGVLTNGCTGGDYCPGPYADIFATLNSPTSVTFTFEGDTASLNGNDYQYIFGGAGGGNLVGLTLATVTGVSLSGSISYTQVFGDAGTLSLVLGGSDQPCDPLSAQHVDGVGCYNVTVEAGKGNTGTANAVDNISFTLTLGGGDTWDCIKGCSDPVLITTLNNQDWLNSITGVSPFNSNSWAEAHISVCTPDASSINNCGSAIGLPTAWAGGAAAPRVAEPGTLTLLGSGLLLVGLVAHRLRK